MGSFEEALKRKRERDKSSPTKGMNELQKSIYRTDTQPEGYPGSPQATADSTKIYKATDNPRYKTRFIKKEEEKKKKEKRKKEEKAKKSNLDQILDIGKQIEKVNTNKALSRDEKNQYKKDLKAKVDSLRADDPVTARIDTLINSLANIKAEPKKPKLSPSKVFNNLSRADGKAVRNKMYEIQSNDPKLKKMERLERALKELGHID